MADTTDPVATALDAIRQRAQAAADFPLEEIATFHAAGTRSISGWIAVSAIDVPSLVAALEAVLALANQWDADYDGTADEPVTATLAALKGAELEAAVRCGIALRSAIAAKLLGSQAAPAGEETSHG